jgi:hypothetical protein
MQGKTQNKAVRNPWGDDHPEKIKQSVPKTIGFSDQIKGLLDPDKMFGQLFGARRSLESYPQVPFREKARTQETLLFSYSKDTEQKKITQETQIILQQLKEQIVLLEKSEKSLAADITKVKVEKLPPKTGIYYLRFLEWLMIVVRQLRMKIEDGRAWLATFMERKKKRIGYWQMYKKHGTTFGLSHERTLATQTG